MYAGSAQVAHGGMPSHNHIGLDRHSQQPSPRGPATTNAPLAQYGSVPVTSASAGSPLSTVDPSLFAIGQADFLSGSPNLHADSQDLLFDHKDLMSMSRLAHATTAGYPDTTYHTATAASPAHTTYASSPPSYEAMAYPRHHNFAIGPDHHADAQSRRYSQSSVSSSASSYDQVDLAAAAMPLPLPHAPPRSSHIDFRTGRGIPNDGRGFHNDVEVGQMMVNMKFEGGDQETPRAGVYNNRGRGSGDSYGFPSTHSNTSSISSAGFSPYSYQGSVDGSEYSTGASEIDSVGSRTLPPPQGLMSTQQPQGLMSTQMPTQQPPPAASMMSQFSSKAKDSTQKKHKCKICDKRFTRPSSLQTHVYSHTGERRKSSAHGPNL